MIFETAATLVLLTQTGLLMHTFYRLRHTDPGEDPWESVLSSSPFHHRII